MATQQAFMCQQHQPAAATAGGNLSCFSCLLLRCCKEWHEQGQEIQPGAFLQYSISRKPDIATKQLLPGSAASRHTSHDVRRVNAAQPLSLGWDLQLEQGIRECCEYQDKITKQLSKTEHNGGNGKSAAIVILECRGPCMKC